MIVVKKLPSIMMQMNIKLSVSNDRKELMILPLKHIKISVLYPMTRHQRCDYINVTNSLRTTYNAI